MKRILIDTNLFTERKGSILFQGILATIIQKAIEDRICKEITRCHKKGTAYSHWVQHVLPQRITMSLCHPADDKLLKEEERGKLQERIRDALFYIESNKSRSTPMTLYFEIIERHFLFERLRVTRAGRNTDHIMMVFYETIPEQPDEHLQEVARDVFKSFGMFAQVK